jgi:predicted nucleotidyltransferase component of viral defense system
MTCDEILVHPPEKISIDHPYSDQIHFKDANIACYNKYEIFAEKIRALFERTRPRDLYDVVSMSIFFKDCDPFLLRKTLYKKCAYKNIENLDVYNLDWSSCKASWKTQLAHQIKELVDFEEYKTSAEFFLKTLIQ